MSAFDKAIAGVRAGLEAAENTLRLIGSTTQKVADDLAGKVHEFRDGFDEGYDEGRRDGGGDDAANR